MVDTGQIDYWQVVGIFISGQPIPLEAAAERSSSSPTASTGSSARQCRLLPAWQIRRRERSIGTISDVTARAGWLQTMSLLRYSVLYVEAMALSCIGDSAADLSLVRLSAATIQWITDPVTGAITRAAVAAGDVTRPLRRKLAKRAGIFAINTTW